MIIIFYKSDYLLDEIEKAAMTISLYHDHDAIAVLTK